MKQIAVIAGAGPAGLTAALELLRRSDVSPIVFEAQSQVGGISKTINYRGNRMDLGGHRFFSKSDWVMRWWQEILPIVQNEACDGEVVRISYQQQSHEVNYRASNATNSDAVMLVRRRISRIFYRRRFFDYPLKLNANSLRNMGLIETLRIGLSYCRAQLRFDQTERTLEEFFINRFGDRLYRTFFKNYTEKVWGVPCSEISAEWGAQRIKGLSITKAVTHALTNSFRRTFNSRSFPRQTETSLIEHFLYPKFGPGQMWEEVARQINHRAGRIHLGHRVIGIEHAGFRITAINVLESATQSVRRIPCDHFVSTMPVRDLVAMLKPDDSQIATVAANLPYRDFLTVGLLVRRMRLPGPAVHFANGMPSDNWIYIQEPDVRVGRLQIFNNWSPSMVADPSTIWLGLEYFCSQGDDLWSMDDTKLIDFATGELEKLGILDGGQLLDGTVVRVPQAYPAYFGQYNNFGKIREYLDGFSNLFAVGRNGMHRYNNQDHSMLSANAAVRSILGESDGKSEIWNINAEEKYLEETEGP